MQGARRRGAAQAPVTHPCRCTAAAARSHIPGRLVEGDHTDHELHVRSHRGWESTEWGSLAAGAWQQALAVCAALARSAACLALRAILPPPASPPTAVSTRLFLALTSAACLTRCPSPGPSPPPTTRPPAGSLCEPQAPPPIAAALQALRLCVHVACLTSLPLPLAAPPQLFRRVSQRPRGLHRRCLRRLSGGVGREVSLILLDQARAGQREELASALRRRRCRCRLPGTQPLRASSSCSPLCSPQVAGVCHSGLRWKLAHARPRQVSTWVLRVPSCACARA